MSDGEDYEFDVDEFEQEAKVAVREYSSSLSRELIIDDEADTIKESKKQRRQKLTVKEVHSALSGTGTGELLDLVCSGLAKVEVSEDLHEEQDEDYVPAISIVARPNAGKSSILNALGGEDRTIVSPISGTTRDAIDTEFTRPDGQKFRLIDTAGIRKRAVVASAGSTTEALSVNRAFRAIRRSDVVALVIEAMACITEQDFKIAERIEKEGKGCLIVVNKWDTIPNKNQQTAVYYEQDVRDSQFR
ncbi:unnamed protein product [Linum trigynum]|uniref:G domain-containing protein n=1 Tax=Linum trigynum TaxID=586398 RepID=A0AAV2CTU0_9ROSI